MAGDQRPVAALQIESLNVVFGGLVALDDVSLDVKAGEIVGIIGPNGAGKTTLFNAICGFVRPRSGAIHYGDRSLLGIAPQQLGEAGIARTLQGLGLWGGLTVLENVMVGAPRRGRPGLASALLGLSRSDRYEAEVEGRARAQLRELGIESYADRRPGALPYGVQKWVSLARALVAEPSLLLLDEPASGLTSQEIRTLADLLRSLQHRVSIALVEHRLDLVMTVCDRVHALDFGKRIASGSPEAIRADQGVTRAYLGEELHDGQGADQDA